MIDGCGNWRRKEQGNDGKFEKCSAEEEAVGGWTEVRKDDREMARTEE